MVVVVVMTVHPLWWLHGGDTLWWPCMVAIRGGDCAWWRYVVVTVHGGDTRSWLCMVAIRGGDCVHDGDVIVVMLVTVVVQIKVVMMVVTETREWPHSRIYSSLTKAPYFSKKNCPKTKREKQFWASGKDWEELSEMNPFRELRHEERQWNSWTRERVREWQRYAVGYANTCHWSNIDIAVTVICIDQLIFLSWIKNQLNRSEFWLIYSTLHFSFW